MAAPAGALLSRLFVSISAEGMDAANKAINSVSKGMGDAKQATDMLQAGMSSLSSAALKVAAPFAAASVAIIGFARAGFQGTVEMNRFTFASQLFSREIAGALVPVLNLLTSIITKVTAAFQSLGPAGQKALLALAVGTTAIASVAGFVSVGAAAAAMGLSLAAAAVGAVLFATVLGAVVAVLLPVITAMTAFAVVLGGVAVALYAAYQSSPALRESLGQLRAALGQLLTALAPVAGALIKIGTILLQAFVVEPLIRFINLLTVAVLILERMAKLSLLLRILPKLDNTGKRDEVKLNQTGEESGSQTFQRIQQSILQLDTLDKTDEQKQTTLLESIEKMLAGFFGQRETAGTPVNPPPAGAIVGGNPAGDGVLGGYLGALGLSPAFGGK